MQISNCFKRTLFICLLTCKSYAASMSEVIALDSKPTREFSDIAWEDIDPIYKAIVKHPFNVQLAKDTLPLESFFFYLQQDYLFLQKRVEALKAAAEKLKALREHHPIITSEDIKYLEDASSKTAEAVTENQIFVDYAVPVALHTSISPTLQTRQYLEFMERNREGHVAESLAGLLPCAWIYQELGESLRDASVHTTQYRTWIGRYSAPARRERVKSFIALTNKVAKLVPPETRINMRRIFKEGAALELGFWEGAFNGISEEDVTHGAGGAAASGGAGAGAGAGSRA